MRSVVHVLPHPGEGAETYLDVLTGMAGWDPRRLALSETRHPGRGALQILRSQPGLIRESRHADLVHAHGEAAAIASLPVLAARPSVWTTHGLHLYRRTTGARRVAAKAALRTLVAAADRTICVAPSERAELIPLLSPRLAAKVVTIENGLPAPPSVSPEERRQAREALGLDDGTVAVLYAGRLEERKDPFLAVRAASAARARGAPVRLLIAGAGPLAGAIEEEADEAIQLLGQRDGIEPLLAAADVFILPSRREGLSYALLEAMGRGLPVIATSIPGSAEGVGDAGVLVEPGDVGAATDALVRLAQDAGERARLGKAAAARVSERFNREQMVDRTESLYEEVVRRS